MAPPTRKKLLRLKARLARMAQATRRRGIMSESTKAVFLSYASEDADAAQRIADGLLAAGVEVWFDQSELRGGDAWDALIKKRLKNCALFMPIISQTTEVRTEGYFRLEWKLAVDRSHLMSEDRAFIVPVVIDDTDDATARVPEAFRARQWTRLQNGAITADFVRQISHLFDLPVDEQRPPAAPRSHSRAMPLLVRRRLPWPALGIAAGVVSIAGVVILMRVPTETLVDDQAPLRATPPRGVASAAAQVAAPKEAAPQSVADRVATNAVKSRPASASSKRFSGLRTAAADTEQPPAEVIDEARPLRIVQGRAFGALEEPKQWAMQMELAFWNSIQTSTMVEDYEEYIRQYPTGRFAGLARNRIKSSKAKR